MESKHYWFSDNATRSILPKDDGKYLYWVTGINDELPIIMSSNMPYEEPLTYAQIIQEAVIASPFKTFLRAKRNSSTVTYNYQEFYSQSLQFSVSLICLGIAQRQAINIIGFNSPEWIIAFSGAILANCVPVGVYTTSGSENCLYIAEHSEAELVVVENESHLKKYLHIWDKLPKVKGIVVFAPKTDLKEYKGERPVFSWEEFMNLGSDVDPQEIENRINSIRATQAVTIVYTSGTTGPPKGVLLSHDNYIFAAKRTLEKYRTSGTDEQFFSYLPYSHVAAQCFDFFTVILAKGCVNFPDESALQTGIGPALKEYRPTFFWGVPRIYEKIEESIKRMIAASTPSQKKMIAWAREIGLKSMLLLFEKKPLPHNYHIANSLFFQPLKEALGFERCKTFLFGAAPLGKVTLEFFLSVGIPLTNLFGMSEAASPLMMNTIYECSVWSVGKPLRGCEAKIVNSKGEKLPCGEIGEIVYKGRNRFLGYLKNEKSTRETIDSQGFLHSGDEGFMDRDGFFTITGRIKELIITAGGENIPPVLIEDEIKSLCKIANSVLCVGDAKKYLALLLTLKRVPNSDGSLSENLTPEVISILKSFGSPASENKTAMECPLVHKYIQHAIDHYNKHAVSRVHQIKKWAFLPQEFSVAGGDLTPTMKLKRSVVHKKNKAIIDKLYEDPHI
ncbi:unnamed protein product [Blepharisma stoltei]|uniref:AMP-dependent synthetase/ligase domain-containing protein n=1 Tax=Blepharisma stoltei TaxID=1481888 RepID=A0AAU9JRT3_9CILI|nr:unnamed protein product [Blepharisma stoltei]